MRNLKFYFCVAIVATVFLNSCSKKCDKNDLNSECYAPATDPAITDAGVVINNVKWATFNIDKPGIFAAAPKIAGMFYQWNKKIGWTPSETMQNSNGSEEWDTTNPEGTEWTKANDPCPQGWRVPKIKELEALLDSTKVKSEWTTQNSINGRKFTDKISNNSIFLPAVGYRYYNGGTLYDVGSFGYYWSNAQYDEPRARCFGFGSSNVYTDSSYRRNGFSVRCVAE